MRLHIVYANGTEPDTEEDVWFSGRPRQAYRSLSYFGTEPDIIWPAGVSSYNMQDGFLFGPNLVTDSFGDDYGVREWSISAEPGHVPGKLQVGLYEDGNADLSSPDVFNEFSLGVGSWDSGPLTVASTALYTAPYFRFIPDHLISLT